MPSLGKRKAKKPVMKTVRELYLLGKSRLERLPQANPAVEAKMLLLRAASLKEQEFFACPDWPLPSPAEHRFLRMIEKRLERWPMAYLTGETEFWSLPFLVFPGVFVPRPETELIVERVKALSSGEKEVVVEIGTGSGIIAVSLARELPLGRFVATDVSRKALQAARLNALRHNVRSVTFIQGDLFTPLQALSLKNRVHFLISNPPYVSEKDWRRCQPEIRSHEPKKALVPGKTGLEFIHRLIQGAAEYLRPAGYLLFEIGAGQANAVRVSLDDAWKDVKITRDLAGIPRVVECRKA
jgi:release factor glutamine methyltransferase